MRRTFHELLKKEIPYPTHLYLVKGRPEHRECGRLCLFRNRQGSWYFEIYLWLPNIYEFTKKVGIPLRVGIKFVLWHEIYHAKLFHNGGFLIPLNCYPEQYAKAAALNHVPLEYRDKVTQWSF
ncbi:MAG: hypothetical protein HY998_04975 [candidate division NC10 bacterium]|nr:hypothetical protein [candidate division NC10 bacterium]